MVEIRIVLHLKNYEKNGLNQIRSIFHNAIFPFSIMGNEVLFSSRIDSKRITESNKSDIARNIRVSFIGELPAEIDMENNDIYYYFGPRNLTKDKISIPELKNFFKHECLDEGFEAQLEIFCLSMVYAIILTAPGINLNTAHFKSYLNQELFKERKYIEYPIYEDAIEEWPHFFKAELNIEQTWDWITKYGIKYASKPLCPVVPLLYYLLNREFFEIILYAVIGLEALYLDNKIKTGKSYTLQNRIHAVFPEISKEKIKKMYSVRSNITHGEGDIASAIVWLDLINNDIENEQMAALSSAIFIESIRLLVAHNAIKFSFKEHVDVDYGFELRII